MGVKTITNFPLDSFSSRRLFQAYEGEVRVAQALMEIFGSDTIKSTYFMSDTEGFCAVIDAKLGNGAFEMINTALQLQRFDQALDIILNGIK